MKPRQVTTIRMSLARLVAACVLPSILMTAALLFYNFQQERAALMADSTATARSLLAIVESEFAGVRASIFTLSTSRLLKSNNLSEFNDQAAEVVLGGSINNIVLIDPTGQQMMNSALPFGTRLPMVRNKAQLERVLKSGQPDVSDMFMGPALKRYVINVAVPVFNGNTVTHSLVGTVLPEQIQKILVSQRFPANRIVAIFDGANTVVAFTGDIEKFRGVKVNDGLAAALLAADEGSLTTINRLGVEVLSMYTRSPTSRWGVAIGIPSSTLTEDLKGTLWYLIAFAGCLLAGSLSLAWLMGGRIALTIGALRSPALALGYGAAVTVPDLPIKEVDEVGKAIEKASNVLTSAHHALAQSEARMRGIVESSTDAIIILDDGCNILLFNSAASAMFGCIRDEAIGNSFFQFIPETERPNFALRLLDRTSGVCPAGRMKPLEIATARRRDGTEFQVELSFPLVLDGDYKVRTLILRDITDRLLIQGELERSNLDLQQFAFVASHDLKTPLRSIGGFMQVLQKKYADRLDEDALSLIQRTLKATGRLENLTEDLLSYARLNSEIKPHVMVDCNEAVGDAIALLDAVINSTRAVVTLGNLPTLRGNRTQLVQLFLNLLSNGIKYCRDRSPVIHLSAEKIRDEWIFSVADNGIGIDASHHDKIFEVFKRLHNEKEFPGTGIGLALCRRIVENHGGTIWVSSVLGQGSTFSFSILDSFRGQ